MSYRKDIDGLRALAVFLVVIFHVNEGLIPGGFIGVDVFFVISGYLITGIISRDIELGNFSFLEFYKRRVKRIFPVAFLVTLVTLIVGILLMLPADVEELSRSALASALFSANIHFNYFLDTSYFTADSKTQPLLHMWSLGVEEQFYLIWPLLLFIIIRNRLVLVLTLLLAILLSLAFSQWMIAKGEVTFAYYMLPTRVFQLAAGALLVIIERQREIVLPSILAFVMGTIGLVLIFGSAFLVNSDSPYPGLNAVPVTFGTVLLLFAGRVTQPLSWMLSIRPLRWLGLISFSLYLWHWPILAFQRYFYPELGIAQQVASLALMVVLSQLSYKFVEVPCRTNPVTVWLGVLKYWLVPTGIVAAISIGHIATSGYGFWFFSSYVQKVESIVLPAFKYDFVCQSPRITRKMTESERCVLGSGDKPNVLLYGDSNSAHYVGAFRMVADSLGFMFRNIAHSACPPILSDPTPFTSTKYLNHCKSSHAQMVQVLPNYDTIILAASWNYYQINGQRKGLDFRLEIKKTIDSFVRKRKKVVLVGIIPKQLGFDKGCLTKRLKFPLLNCEAVSFATLPPAINVYLKKLAESTQNVWYLDSYPGLCNKKHCATSRNGQPLYYDSGHLSMLGSQIVGSSWLHDHSTQSKVLEEAFTVETQ